MAADARDSKCFLLGVQDALEAATEELLVSIVYTNNLPNTQTSQAPRDE